MPNNILLFCGGYFRQSRFEENVDLFLPLCLVNMSLVMFSAAILQVGAVKTGVLVLVLLCKHMLCVGMNGRGVFSVLGEPRLEFLQEKFTLSGNSSKSNSNSKIGVIFAKPQAVKIYKSNIIILGA